MRRGLSNSLYEHGLDMKITPCEAREIDGSYSPSMVEVRERGGVLARLDGEHVPQSAPWTGKPNVVVPLKHPRQQAHTILRQHALGCRSNSRARRPEPCLVTVETAEDATIRKHGDRLNDRLEESLANQKRVRQDQGPLDDPLHSRKVPQWTVRGVRLSTSWFRQEGHGVEVRFVQR